MNYRKNKNTDFCKQLEEILDVTSIQNYIPLLALSESWVRTGYMEDPDCRFSSGSVLGWPISF